MESDITLSQLCENFKKAIIIDIGRKVVWVIKGNKCKVYPEDKYKELLSGLDFSNFEDDTNGD